MFWFLLIVASLNCGLGYACAQFLGGGSRCAPLQWKPRFPSLPRWKWRVPLLGRRRAASAAPTDPAASEKEKGARAGSVPAPQRELESAAAESEQVRQTARVQGDVERLIEETRVDLNRFRNRLAKFDHQVRSQPNVSADVLAEWLQAWRQEAQEQALKIGERREQIAEQRPHAPPATWKPLDDAAYAIDHLSAQMEAFANNTAEWTATKLEELGPRPILLELTMLLDGAHEIRDGLDAVIREVARVEHRLGLLEPEFARDALTSVASRALLEAAIDEVLQEDQARRQACIGVLDLDHFRLLNEQYGVSVGDNVLRSVGSLVAEVAASDARAHVVGRYAGQRFMLMFVDTGPRNTTAVLERLRQTIGAAEFQSAWGPIAVTASCGVAEAKPGESAVDLMLRISQTLDEAKRYGRDRTFLHDEKTPIPVMPPQYSIEPPTFTV